MQLITDHVFVIKTYYKNSSYLEVKEAFRGKPLFAWWVRKTHQANRRPWKNIKRSERKRTTLKEDAAGEEQPRPTKQLKLLDRMSKIILQMSVVDETDLD